MPVSIELCDTWIDRSACADVQGNLPSLDFLQALLVGLKLDFSMTAYTLLLPTVCLLGMVFFQWKGFSNFLTLYSLLALFLYSLVIVADMKLYGYWGAKLDRQALIFLETPGDAMASLKIGELSKQGSAGTKFPLASV